jgi:anthranilate phosphoribosyltransferase
VSVDPPSAVAAVIRHLTSGESIPPDELTAAFKVIFAGEATPVQISALLMGLRVKGETPAEVAAVVRALRRAMVVLPADRPEDLVDTCGTGGGAVPTFNISTAAALLAAGAGLRVAKHGNRSFTTQCGSADVLEMLGVAIEASVPAMARSLAEAGIVFMFAPAMHPAMRHVGPIRRELGVQTVMNIVGPLANPARAGRQVVGVADERRMPLIAGALQELGSVHAMIVHGSPGMDEISPLGPTFVIEIRGGKATEWVIHPSHYGIEAASAAELAGGSPAHNAEMVVSVLDGAGTVGSTGAVVLNAAAALYVGGMADTFAAAVALARAAMVEKAGIAALERLRGALPTPAG